MRRLLAAAGFLLAATAGAETFVVLPFFNASKTANLDWVGESISETIRDALFSQGLLALDRDERREAYRRLSIREYSVLTRASVIKIGEELDADGVIYGQFDLVAGSSPASKGSLRMSGRVLDLKRMKQSAGFGEVGALEDLATLERHLAWQTLKLVAPENAPSEQEFEKKFPTVRLDAIENYIRGLLATAPEQKLRLFSQAARLDARYSQPCFQLGRLNWERKSYQAAAEWLAHVPSGDPHYREATFLLGLCRYYRSDYAAAAESFEIVARSIPLNEVLNNLGAAQSRRGLPQALDNFEKALEGDPSDPAYHFNVGYVLWKRADFAAAAERFRAVLDRDPGDSAAISMLGRCLKKEGPRLGDPRTEGLERLKHEYQETAYLQLKEALERK